MLTEIINEDEIKNRMNKTIDAMQVEFSKMRTGRANPEMITHLPVSCYGDDMPLNQLASVTVEDARTLSVTPWDKANVAAIEKAIRSSDLGLNPSTAGTVIRVPLPGLTEETRKEMIKLVRKSAETVRVSIRNIRRDVLGEVRVQVKAKTVTADDERRVEQVIQKLTDHYIKEIDRLLALKEDDLMTI